jgi:hypothetical protein
MAMARFCWGLPKQFSTGCERGPPPRLWCLVGFPAHPMMVPAYR